MNNPSDELAGLPPRTGPLAFMAAFVVLNLLMPVLFGDLFPFTSAPMFRDQPRQYCNYVVYAPDGRELQVEDFLLQRVYDGNPPGMGVGIQPPNILEKTFGDVASKEQVFEHVQAQLERFPDLEFVDVEQVIFEGNDQGTIGRRLNRWRIPRVDAS